MYNKYIHEQGKKKAKFAININVEYFLFRHGDILFKFANYYLVCLSAN